MSCPEREPDLPLAEVKCNTAYVSTYHVYEISEPTHIINECLDALMYHDAEFRPLTHSTIKLLEAAKRKMGEANALLIEGVRMYSFRGVPFKLFAQAEEKGCKHPVLYYFMGECYRDGNKGAAKNVTKALEYYEKAIAGGCSWGFLGRHRLLNLSEYYKTRHYLLDLEREGHIDGVVFKLIADQSDDDSPLTGGESMAKVYYQRAIDSGYAYAAVYQLDCLDPSEYGGSRLSLDDKRLLFLLDSDRKGVGIKDDRILKEAMELLFLSKLDPPCPFKNKGEMALHYCDVLIQRRSPWGYKLKERIYKGGLDRIHWDESKANALREEADRLGLATRDMYNELIFAYGYGRGVLVNGLKVLEYCEKALQVARSDNSIQYIYERMAEVYEKGIKPVKEDGRKVVECYERAFQSTLFSLESVSILRKLADVYVKGLAPVPPNGAKALEYYIKALELVRYNQTDIYLDMASVYGRGITPIADNITLAGGLRQIARGHAWR